MKQIKKYILCACLTAVTLLAGEGVVWGYSHYAKVTASANPTGKGNVYVSTSNGNYSTNEATSSDGDSGDAATFYIKADNIANSGYHFSNWVCTSSNSSKLSFAEASSNTTSLTANRSTSNDGTEAYTIQANFVENFYAKITPSHDGHGSGNPTVTSTNPQNSVTPNTDLTFTVSAANAASGYHFDQWEVTDGTPTTSTYASPLTVTVKSATTGGSTNATNCQVKAVYAQNYYAALTANVMTGASGTASATPKTSNNSATSGGNIVFNITAPDAIAGYHWDGWQEVTGVTYGDKTKQSTTATVAASTTPGGTASYSIVAKYAINHYVRVNTAKNISEGGTAYVCYGDSFSGTETSAINGNGKGWQGANETFSVKATPASGYHFVNWSITGDGTITDNTSASTTVIGKTKAGNTGEDNPYIYTVTANFAQNTYYAALSATSGGNGTVTVDSSPKSTTTSGGDLVFNLSITPISGYHFDKIEFTTGSGTISGNTVTVAASSNYAVDGDNKAAQYAVKVTFAKDMYNAKLTTAISSISDASTSTAQVSSDNSNWYDNVIYAAEAGNTDVTFYVKATPAAGYKFVGWSTSNGSSTTVSGLGATGTYTFKSASAIGETNAKTLYAIFKAQYDIVINANCSSASDDRIVFNVTGPANYRVSVPVGRSITLKDVASGTYTITPEGSWSWAYTVSPTEGTTSFDGENKSTHNFTVNAKSSTKKHDEVVNVIEP